jgi:hypothetical protein
MMAFAQSHSGAQFVVSIIDSSGKILRESNQNNRRECYLDFESEYKIRLWNKSKRRAYAHVEIDGMDVLGGRRFILHPGEKFDLERHMVDGDLTKGKRFKFVSVEKGIQTGELQDPTSAENGKIRIRFEPEKEYPSLLYPQWGINQPIINTLRTEWICTNNSSSGVFPTQEVYGTVTQAAPSVQHSSTLEKSLLHNAVNNVSCAVNGGSATTFTDNSAAFMNAVCDAAPAQSAAGGTAEGSHSNQTFGTSQEFFVTENPVYMEIWLRGKVESKPNPFWNITWSKQPCFPPAPIVTYQGRLVEGIRDVQIGADGITFKIDPKMVGM